MSAQPVEVTMDAPRVTIHVGDCRDVLKTLPAQSVHCVVTSPPYFGLRDYGSGEWEGGDPACEHQVRTPGAVAKSQASSTLTSTSREVVGHTKEGYRDVCARCGARRADRQIGLEADVAAYVAALMDVFAEVWRVLRDDGSLFLNIGDSYAGSGKGPTGKHGVGHHEQRQGFHTPARAAGVIRAKSMMCIPERILIALSDAGWIVRDKIVWHKLAPMPSSATDRCTGAWEPVYHLTKQQRYYGDMEAVRETPADYERKGGTAPYTADGLHTNGIGSRSIHQMSASGANLRNVWSLSPAPFDSAALGVDVEHYACVDEATECLTKCGWKTHDELVEGELIAAYDMDTQELHWTSLEMVARYNVQEQPLVYIESTAFDMALTPNHRCVVRCRTEQHTRRRIYGGPTIRRADELRANDAIPTAAPWRGDGEDVDPAWAELLGWYIAEGNPLKGSMTVEISQSLSVNAPKVERLRELLNTVEADFHEATGHREWRGREAKQTQFRIKGYAAARLREMAPYKQLTPDVLGWSTKALRALMNGLIDGDGHTRIDDGRISFIQKNKQTADLVHAIAIRLGWSAKLSLRQDGPWVLYLTKHDNRTLRTTGGAGLRIEQRPYTGVVWCPKTQDGTWVARRNGRVYITGNTFPPELPRRCVSIGTSDKGVCAKCGKPWTRVVEREVGNPSVLAVLEAGSGRNRHTYDTPLDERGGAGRFGDLQVQRTTTGWQPSCKCSAPVAPAVVLDPFAGAGTTLLVANRLGRHAIGIELNPKYARLEEARIRADAGMFANVEVIE